MRCSRTCVNNINEKKKKSSPKAGIGAYRLSVTYCTSLIELCYSVHCGKKKSPETV